MDQLSKDAAAARRAGLSYGRYMATKYQPQEKPKPKAKKKKEEGPKCVLCGTPIPPYSQRRLYCSAACADRAVTLRELKKVELRNASHSTNVCR